MNASAHQSVDEAYYWVIILFSLQLEHAKDGVWASQQRQAEGGCQYHTDPAPDILLSTLSKLWLSAEPYLTNAYLRDARGDFHNRTQMALPRSYFRNWFCASDC